MTVSLRRRQGPNEQPSASRIALLALLAFGLFATAGFGFWLSRAAAEQRSEAEQAALTIEVFELRSRMAWIHHGLLTDGLLGELTGAEVDQERVDVFQEERRSILVRLGEISERGDSTAAGSASELLVIYEQVSFGSWPFDALDLDDQHYESVSPDDPDHGENLVRTMLPSLVLADALSVEFDRAPTEPPSWAIEYLDYTFDTVESAPGWLGPDRASPFEDHVLLGPTAAVDNNPVGDQLSPKDLVDLALIWDYDQWLIAESESGFQSEPPLSIDELARAVNAVNEQVRSSALVSLQDSGVGVLAAAPGTATIWSWLAVGIVSLLSALASVVIIARRLWGSHRTLANDAYTDALTGAWNRRYLEQEVASRFQRPDYHHVIVMIDLDLFKIVNDTWGHSAGDSLLVVMTERLQVAADELCGPWEESFSAVVRSGGDEFIIALHAPGRFAVEHIDATLRTVAGPIDLGLEEAIDLQFSLGIADADHPIDLDDLLRSADLAAYEDKRQRATERARTNSAAGGSPILRPPR